MKQPHDFFTIYKQTAWNKDINSMIALYDDEVVIYDMWEKGYQTGLVDWSGVIKDWLSSLGEEKVNVNFEMINVRESGDVGFGNSLVSYQAIAPDTTILRSMKNRITIGFHKKNGVWKVIHQHTSAPINDALTAILDF
jgi:ketosteroid isomerase-like protein